MPDYDIMLALLFLGWVSGWMCRYYWSQLRRKPPTWEQLQFTSDRMAEHRVTVSQITQQAWGDGAAAARLRSRN